MSTKTKKRNKKYRPREVRTPAYLFKIYPELSDAALDDLDLQGFVPLDAIARGNGSMENVCQVTCALRAAFTMSAAFDNKDEIQRLCYLATAGLAAAAGEMDMNEPVTESYLDPVRDVLVILGDMHRALSRDQLIEASRATIDNRDRILKTAQGAMHIVNPDEKTWKRMLGKLGFAYLNGRGRTGKLHRNKVMDRLEWVDVEEEVTIPITGDTLVVLAQPVLMEE